MAADSKIEWTDHTFNPWIGCTKVSIAATGGGGCDHCYAEVSTPVRVLRGKGAETWGAKAQRVRTSPLNWALPKRWNAHADAFMAQHGRRQRVFCASLADVFDNAVPPEWRWDLWQLIKATPHLDWLLLTKRIGNVAGMLKEPGALTEGLPSNVWLGATIVNPDEADRDVARLLAVSAQVHFLSMEPLLSGVWLGKYLRPTCVLHGALDADGICGACASRGVWEGVPERVPHGNKLPRVDWVIVGGESGPSARPMHPDWARSLRDQCQAAGVPFFFKQWGAYIPVQDGGDELQRVGVKAAGRLLDGRTWDQFPGEVDHGAA